MFGEVRQLPNKLVAIRTAYPPDGAMAWLVADPNLAPSGGGHYASQREIDAVKDWVDLTPVVEA